ncbi:MAG: heavy metal-binding domain-containing protein [Byssovorax sp.]
MLAPRLATLVTLAASLTIGCADGTLPPVTSLADPSNPAAPEAPLAPPPAMFGPAASSPSAAPMSPPGTVVYVCPMHSQIVRDAPGVCPICGMTLVPRPAPAAHEHGGAK